MKDEQIWEQHKLLQSRLFMLEDKQQDDFRDVIKLKNTRIKRGKEITDLRNKIRALYGKQSLKTNEEIKKGVI